MLLFAYKLIISTRIFIFFFFLPSYNPFNTNISHQLFDYTITIVNSQHKNTNSKVDFLLRIGMRKLISIKGLKFPTHTTQVFNL